MKPKVYIETTIVSYLVSSPSRDIVVAGHQQVTREWWELRNRFDLFVSQAVLEEASRGDTEQAKRRAAVLSGMPVLPLSDEVVALANALVRSNAVPPTALIDAIHIAVAAAHRMDYLVTWNCTHIANAAIRGKIEEACRAAGLKAPTICTPEELMEP